MIADLERTTDVPVAHFAETKELANQARRNLAYATLDSPLEEAGFEFLVPQIKSNSAMLTPDAMAGISVIVVFDAHLA